MRNIFFRLILASSLLLIQGNDSYAGIEDLIRGLRQLVGSNAANHMDHLIRTSPGRFLDSAELEYLVRTTKTDFGDFIINRTSLSIQQRSQARIIDRLIYEAEAVLDVPNPNLARFTQGVVKIPVTNLTKRGIIISKSANIYQHFQKTHRELHQLLDQFEVLKGRLSDLDPRVEEYLDGLGRTASSHRALAETLGDIISISDRAIADSVVGEAEKMALFSRFFRNLSPIFEELQSAKILMETHVGRLSAWLKATDGGLPSGFDEFLERHADSTLAQRFSRIYRISEDSLETLQQEYATLFRPLLLERRVGAAEEMLTLLWTREGFKALRSTLQELGSSLSRYPSLKDISTELESIMKARSSLINNRLAEARLKILFPNWEKNAASLKSQLSRVQGKYTTTLPNMLDPSVQAVEVKRHISAELNRVVQEGGNPAAAISGIVGEIDDVIDTISRTPTTNIEDLLSSTNSLRAALSTLNNFIGHATNSLGEIGRIGVSGDLSSGVNYVIKKPEIRQMLREYIGLRRQIVEDLEIQLIRIVP